MNTNKFGKAFETISSIEELLINNNFKKYYFDKKKQKENYYLIFEDDKQIIIFVKQNGLKKFVKNIYNIDLFRKPDEAFFIFKNGKTYLKIIEKKEQHIEGSVETKLWAADGLLFEYQEMLGNDINIEYIFSLCCFFEQKFNDVSNKKYQILKKYLSKRNIKVLFFNDSYQSNLFKIITS